MSLLEYRNKAAMLRDLAARARDAGEKADLLFLAAEYDSAATAASQGATDFGALIFPH